MSGLIGSTYRRYMNPEAYGSLPLPLHHERDGADTLGFVEAAMRAARPPGSRARNGPRPAARLLSGRRVNVIGVASANRTSAIDPHQGGEEPDPWGRAWGLIWRGG